MLTLICTGDNEDQAIQQVIATPNMTHLISVEFRVIEKNVCLNVVFDDEFNKLLTSHVGHVSKNDLLNSILTTLYLFII